MDTVTTADLLADIPGLAAFLPVAGHNPDQVKTTPPPPGPRPPVRLDLVQMLDTRYRYPGTALDRAAADDIWGDHRQGVQPDLMLWALFFAEQNPAITDLIPNDLAQLCAWLGRRSEWAEKQDWGDTYVKDVKAWHTRLLRGCGDAPLAAMHHACTRCGNDATLVNAGDLWACAECGHEDPGPAQQIRTFRFQPSRPTPDICDMFRVERGWLYTHKKRRNLTPDPTKGTDPLHWWPWDVFRLLHPGLVDLYEQHTESGTHVISAVG